MHDSQHVIGARGGESAQDRRIADRLIGGTPRVDRVADVAHRGQLRQDGRARGLRHRRQVETSHTGKIGDQGRLAGRHGDDASPAPTHAPAQAVATGMQLGRLEQFVQIRAADHPGRGEGRIGDPVFAGQRAAVGEGGGPCLGRATHLHGQDRFAQLECAIGQGQESFRPFEPLDEQQDRVGFRVVQAVGQEVAYVEDDLGTGPDDATEPDPGPRMDERVGDAAALGDSGHAAAG